METIHTWTEDKQGFWHLDYADAHCIVLKTGLRSAYYRYRITKQGQSLICPDGVYYSLEEAQQAAVERILAPVKPGICTWCNEPLATCKHAELAHLLDLDPRELKWSEQIKRALLMDDEEATMSLVMDLWSWRVRKTWWTVDPLVLDDAYVKYLLIVMIRIWQRKWNVLKNPYSALISQVDYVVRERLRSNWRRLTRETKYYLRQEEETNTTGLIKG